MQSLPRESIDSDYVRKKNFAEPVSMHMDLVSLEIRNRSFYGSVLLHRLTNSVLFSH